MNRATWKAHERTVARVFGGQRVPVTGRSRGSAPDVEHPTFAIEVKAGAVLSSRLLKGMAQAKAYADRTGKLPIVVVINRRVDRERATPAGWYVLLPLKDFAVLAGLPVPEGE